MTSITMNLQPPRTRKLVRCAGLQGVRQVDRDSPLLSDRMRALWAKRLVTGTWPSFLTLADASVTIFQTVQLCVCTYVCVCSHARVCGEQGPLSWPKSALTWHPPLRGFTFIHRTNVTLRALTFPSSSAVRSSFHKLQAVHVQGPHCPV